jgi:hypothetical protein
MLIGDADKPPTVKNAPYQRQGSFLTRSTAW